MAGSGSAFKVHQPHDFDHWESSYGMPCSALGLRTYTVTPGDLRGTLRRTGVPQASVNSRVQKGHTPHFINHASLGLIESSFTLASIPAIERLRL